MKKLSTTTGWLVGHAVVALTATLVAGCGGGGGGGGGSASTFAPVTSLSGSSGDLVALEISPPGDLLIDQGISAGFQVIVDGYHRDASVLDLTRSVSLKVADETVCKVGGDGLIVPVGPGTTELSVTETDATGQTLQVTKSITVQAGGASPVFTGGSLKIYPEFRTLGEVDAAAGRDQLQQIVIVGTDAAGRMWDLTRVQGVAIQDMNRAVSMAGQLSPSGLFRGIVDGQEVLLVTRIDSAGLVAGADLVLGSGAAHAVPASALYSGAPLSGSSNPLDQAVLGALRGQFIEPSKLTTDGDFVRRLYSDALGRLPTAAEAEAFLTATATTKRDAEIDKVVAMDAFADRWGTQIGEWFEIRRANATAFDLWAAGEIKAGKTLAEIVTQLAAGTGAGGALFDAQHPTAANKVDILLVATTGMTAKCSQCHDHPLAGPSDSPKWLQSDRFPLDAFFAATPVEATALDKTSTRVGQPYQPGFVLDTSKTVTSTLTTPIAARRAEIATLLTGSTQFRRGLAHRMFAEVCAPLLDPNQFLAKNLTAVAVPAMLDALTTALDGQQTSLKGFLAVVFKSKVYQLSGDGKDTTNDAIFARHVARRAQSEVMESLVANVTGAPLVGADQTFFRQTFGYPADRVTIEERSTAVNLSQSLVLMNSPAVQAKLTAPTSAIGALAAQVTANTITQEQAVRTLFKTALSREPSSDELGFSLDTVKAAPTVRAGLEDVAAVLMSTIEAVAR